MNLKSPSGTSFGLYFANEEYPTVPKIKKSNGLVPYLCLTEWLTLNYAWLIFALQHLNRQVEALDKLTKLTDSIKERASEPADRRLRSAVCDVICSSSQYRRNNRMAPRSWISRKTIPVPHVARSHGKPPEHVTSGGHVLFILSVYSCLRHWKIPSRLALYCSSIFASLSSPSHVYLLKEALNGDPRWWMGDNPLKASTPCGMFLTPHLTHPFFSVALFAIPQFFVGFCAVALPFWLLTVSCVKKCSMSRVYRETWPNLSVPQVSVWPDLAAGLHGEPPELQVAAGAHAHARGPRHATHIVSPWLCTV